MLKRKIEDTLIAWKNKPGHKPLVIMGIRQCGKTYISQHFAEQHYKNVVYMNFIKQPERIKADKYHVKQIIKFGDYNVGRDGQLLTLPNYMQFLLDLEPEEIILKPIDVDVVNALAREILQ